MSSSPWVVSKVTSNAQQYLVEIARMEESGEALSLTKLARRLNVALPSALEMCKRLDRQGLLRYLGHQGLKLTPRGRVTAQRVLGRHRLWETMLIERLGLNSKQAHDAACQLEHATTEAVADALDDFLGKPATNPGGDPIYRHVDPVAASDLALTDLRPGDVARVVRISDDSPAGDFFAEQGIVAGAEIKLRAVAAKSLLVETAAATTEVDIELAGAVEVLRLSSTKD